ncbi:MAG: hypothetical protein ACJAZO_003092 [Myxococcota bacterium]|jgi:hypothetical protein
MVMGCGGTEVEATVEPVLVTVVANPALAHCQEMHCGGVVDVEACLVLSCPQTAPTITAGVKTIRFDEHTLYIELTPTYTAGSIGDVDVPRTAPIYVGVTAVTPSGTEIDLLVQEMIPGGEIGSVVFTAELDDLVDHVLIGLWDEKIAPCDVDRGGCKEFGFVLDGSLATYPPNVYETGHRQRLLQGPVDLQISAARGLDESRVRELREAIEEAAAPVVDVFGAELNISLSQAVDRSGIEVRYAHPRDVYLASQIGNRLQAETGVTPLLRYTPEGGQHALQVTLGPDTAAQ